VKRRSARSDARLDLELSPPEVHTRAAAVFDVLDGASIRWSLLRGEHRLATPPHDVDLLVASYDLDRAADVLAPLGFTRFPTWARGTHQFFVAYDEEYDYWLQLDVVTELAYGPHYCVRTDAASRCLARTVRFDGLRALCADDAFWTLLLHCVLDRGEIPPHQEERLTTLAKSARIDGPLARVVTAAAPAGYSAATALQHVREGEWQALLMMRRPLIRRWMQLHPLKTSERIARGVLQWRTEPLHRFLRRRGLSVLLTGADVHVVSALAESLGESFFPPVRVVPFTSSGRSKAPKSKPPRLGARAGFAAVRHRAGGRIVLIHAASTRPPTRRAGFDLVITLSDRGRPPTTPLTAGPGRVQHVVVGTADLERARRAVTAQVWRRYRELRGWDVLQRF
jgi:hypothetical protein